MYRRVNTVQNSNSRIKFFQTACRLMSHVNICLPQQSQRRCASFVVTSGASHIAIHGMEVLTSRRLACVAGQDLKSACGVSPVHVTIPASLLLTLWTSET
jgi:hypothetical protein